MLLHQTDHHLDNEVIRDLLAYHFSQNNLPAGADVFKRELLLFVLGLGGLNYVPVAYQNGSNDSIKIINAVTTAIFGWMVLYASGLIYYNIKIRPQYVDPVLAPIIAPPLTRNAFIKELRTQVFWALASAVPLATTLFSADIPLFEKYPEMFWAAFVYILVVNTVMHLIPVELTMNDPLYGYIPQLMSRFLRWILSCCYQPSSQPEQETLALRDRNAIVADLKKIFEGKDALLNDLNQLSSGDQVGAIARYKTTPSELLSDMRARVSLVPPLGSFEQGAVRFCGAVLMFISCLGYAASPYLVFKNDFKRGKDEAIGLVILPLYFFMLLMIFFGDNIAVRFWKDVWAAIRIGLGLSDVTHKAPLIAKLYPKTFLSLQMVMLFSIIFAGAAAREMTKMAFDGVLPDKMILVIIGITDTVLALLAGYVFLDVSKIMLTHYAQYRDKNPLVILKAQIEAFSRDLDRIKPEHAQKFKEYFVQLPRTESIDSDVEAPKLSDNRFCFCCSRRADDTDDAAKRLLGSDPDGSHSGSLNVGSNRDSFTAER
ncbi:MAG: hypothetical protein LRY67_06685 [Gammaproteobacteria bacterium]|nr:hypothetical protein [Gammaproteobacteria bacterium]MCD8542521.1 hypothetical protein [Gammaproteobacteria bacterium]